MDALWNRFVAELISAGYTIDDLSICNDDLFLSIAEELRVFSQTEVTKLTQEWRRRFGAAKSGASPAIDAAGASRAVMPAYAMDAPTLLDAASHLVRRVAGVDHVAVQRGSVEVAPLNAATGASSLSSKGPVHTLWKLCSPSTLAKLRRGAPLSADDDANDDVCGSGLVLYRDSAVQLRTPVGTVEKAAAKGWALAAFAVSTGVSRSVARREAQNLSHYRPAQCQAMMSEAGYDTLRVEDDDCFVVFSPASVQWLGAVALTAEEKPQPQQQQQATLPAPATTATAATPTVPPRPERERERAATTTRLLTTPAHASVPKPQPAGSASPGSWMGTSVTGADDGLLSTRCSLHPQKEVEFWSPQEKRLLCSHCLYYNGYSQENCIPIEQATQLEVRSLEKWMQNVATFAKEIAGVMDAFDNAEADVQRQQERAVEVIHQEFARLRSKLDAMERELLAQCEASAKDAWQQLHTSSQDVTRTVQQVQKVVQDAAEPLQRFRDGFTDQAVCIRLLRCVQRAFATWATVPVPPYMVIEGVKDGVFLQSVSSAFDVVPLPSLVAGQVELPEAVDINFLKNGCTD